MYGFIKNPTPGVLWKATGRDDENEIDPFALQDEWDADQMAEANAPADEEATKLPVELPPAPKGGRHFAPEEIRTLRHLAGIHAANYAIDRNHNADAKASPRLHREAHLHQAHNQVFDSMHDNWRAVHDSPEYQKASLPQKWKMQADFLNKHHQENPDHHQQAMSAIVGAHQKGSAADLARVQEEKRRAENNLIGGGLGAMSDQDARANLGVQVDDDSAPELEASQAVGPRFAAAHKDAAARALSDKRFADVPTEDVETHQVRGKAPIVKHPDLQKPENKKLMDEFARRYVHLTHPGFIDHIKQKIGAGNAKINEDAISHAGERAMWLAMRDYDAKRGRGTLDNHIKSEIVRGLIGHIRQQHTSEVGAAVKREAKAEQKISSDPQRTAGLKIYTPEEKAALAAKYAAASKPAEPQPFTMDLNEPAAPATPTSPAPATPPPAATAAPKPADPSKPHFSTHLDDAQKERLQHAKAARVIVRRKGEGQ